VRSTRCDRIAGSIAAFSCSTVADFSCNHWNTESVTWVVILLKLKLLLPLSDTKKSNTLSTNKNKENKRREWETDYDWSERKNFWKAAGVNWKPASVITIRRPKKKKIGKHLERLLKNFKGRLLKNRDLIMFKDQQLMSPARPIKHIIYILRWDGPINIYWLITS
jgi:hypothetical protein